MRLGGPGSGGTGPGGTGPGGSKLILPTPNA